MSDTGSDQKVQQDFQHQNLVQGVVPEAGVVETRSKETKTVKVSLLSSLRTDKSADTDSKFSSPSYTLKGQGRRDSNDEDRFLQPVQTVNMNDLLSGCESKIGLARPLIGPNGRVIFGTWSELSEEELAIDAKETACSIASFVHKCKAVGQQDPLAFSTMGLVQIESWTSLSMANTPCRLPMLKSFRAVSLTCSSLIPATSSSLADLA